MSRSFVPAPSLALLLLAGPAAAGPAVVDEHFRVDQFGWRSGDPKVAVVADPRVGFDAPDPFTPSATLELRRFDDDVVVFSGPAVPWRAGAVHDQSGDAAWSFDFSSVTAAGSYYLFDPVAGVGSHRFEIAQPVYAELMVQALRSLLYQRCGMEKSAAAAGADWADPACHLGAEQDLDCRPVGAPAPGTGRDLSGGWHDAGDYNKYVNFTDGAVHDLLAAWQENPQAFTDAAGLPESGNGVPDVLDEVRVELDWFLRMQLPDGSVLHKVSVTDWSAASPPSADAGPRRHAPATASATIAACGAFAHGATVFARLGLPETDALAATLEAAALLAWDWLEANPGAIPSAYDNAGFTSAAAEEGAYEQAANRTAAAVYLFERTGDTRFRDHVDATFRDVHLIQWGFVYAFEPEYQDALLLYASLPDASPLLASEIKDAYRASINGADNLQHHLDGDDPYGAWLSTADHVWGSNRTRSHSGLLYLLALRHGLDPARDGDYLAAGARYLHYLQGLNPLGLVYLTNLADQGAERSLNTLYHSWFADGTDWDEFGVSRLGPPPGILSGGPNPGFAPDPSYAGPPLEPPQNQPVQKSYRDWNTGFPENSWEVTENQVAYQAAYLRLLAWFAQPPPTGGLGISAQPTAVEVCAGEAASFRVTATGRDPLSYRWRRNGVELNELAPYSGTDRDLLTIDPVSASEAGSYDVLVSDSSGREIASEAAELTVLEPSGAVVESLRVSKAAGALQLTWLPVSGATGYVLRRCDAGLGACVPAPVAWPVLPEQIEPELPAAILWYLVEAEGPCP